MPRHPDSELHQRIHFNSHPHKEDDQHWSESSWRYRNFNSHPHEEDDFAKASPVAFVPYFNSHPHKEDDPTERFAHHSHIPFQLTSSQGGWRHGCRTVLSRTYFNSHPHKEDDSRMVELLLWTIISTHILTRRMTGYLTAALEKIIISTHILTRRMTCRILYFNWESNYFNSHPHKEDDKFFHIQYGCIFVISTHILTRRMTLRNHTTIQRHFSFQLTSSQGGWP